MAVTFGCAPTSSPMKASRRSSKARTALPIHRSVRACSRQNPYPAATTASADAEPSADPKAFVQRQRDKGRSTPEILRILKRAIAREMFKQLTRPHEGLGVQDLRPARQAKNITLDGAARALGLDPMTISRTERGKFVTPEVVNRYREWLRTA